MPLKSDQLIRYTGNRLHTGYYDINNGRFASAKIFDQNRQVIGLTGSTVLKIEIMQHPKFLIKIANPMAE